MSKVGDILWYEYVEPLNIEPEKLAKDLGIAPQDLSGIMFGGQPIDNQMAEKLGHLFGTTTQFWINLQNADDRAKELERVLLPSGGGFVL